MIIKGITSKENLATVYLAELAEGKYAEFVESFQPPLPLWEKWVLIVSTSVGCPIKCKICDAGGLFRGYLTAEEMIGQLDYMIDKRFPDRTVPVKKFKIQFARMGEPALNMDVLEVIGQLTQRYDCSGLMPCLSTIAPKGRNLFFDRLMKLKHELFARQFQLQFSLHSTDDKVRDFLMPVKKLSFRQIAQYGEKFYDSGGRKISLNFALMKECSIDPDILKRYFDPAIFLIKLTPLNPTYTSQKHNLHSDLDISSRNYRHNLVDTIIDAGYEVILSVGEPEENLIGSNCGQLIRSHLERKCELNNAYTYPVDSIRKT